MFHQFQARGSCGIALEPFLGSRLWHLWLHRRRNWMNGLGVWRELQPPGVTHSGHSNIKQNSGWRGFTAIPTRVPGSPAGGFLLAPPQPHSPRSHLSLPKPYWSVHLSNQCSQITSWWNFSDIRTFILSSLLSPLVDFALLTLLAVINSFIHAFARVGVRRPDPIMSHLLFGVAEENLETRMKQWMCIPPPSGNSNCWEKTHGLPVAPAPKGP